MHYLSWNIKTSKLSDIFRLWFWIRMGRNKLNIQWGQDRSILLKIGTVLFVVLGALNLSNISCLEYSQTNMQMTYRSWLLLKKSRKLVFIDLFAFLFKLNWLRWLVRKETEMIRVNIGLKKTQHIVSIK